MFLLSVLQRFYITVNENELFSGSDASVWVISDDISTADMSKHDACFGHSRRLMDAGLLALGTLQGRCGMREVTPMTDLGHVNHKDSNTHMHTQTLLISMWHVQHSYWTQWSSAASE